MKTNQKAFTLIELIGVIAVLAVILLVALPTLTRTLRNNANQQYANVLKDIFLAAEQYSLVNKEQYPQLEDKGGRATITIKELEDAGYLNQHLENPKTGKEFLDTDYVLIEVKDDYTRDYKFNEGEATLPPEATAPTYTVDPGSTVWTNQGKTVTIHYPNVSKNRYIFEYSLDGGRNWTVTQNLNTEVWFSENGYIIARVRDTYNERENLNGGVFNVTRIDKIPPTCSSTGGSKTWTSGMRTITGKCSDTGGSGCKGNISYTYNAAVNTNWILDNAGPAGAGKAGTVYDNAGNSANCQANQSIRLDRKKPSCTSSGGNANWIFGGSVTLTGKCSDDGSGCKGNVTKTFYPETDTKTASPGIVYDNVGNSTACPANQEVHVTEKLEAPIITNPTNGNWVNYNFSLNVKTPNNKVKVGYWQYRYASISWQTYSNSAKNTFTTTPYSAERNELTYIRYCMSNGKCSPEASTMIRIDKTPPYWKVSMHAGGHHYQDGSYQPFTCYAKIDMYDPASGLEGIYDLVGNSGSIMMEYGPFGGANATGPDGLIMGSFGAYYAYYGFRLCDMAKNCKNQPRVAGYC